MPMKVPPSAFLFFAYCSWRCIFIPVASMILRRRRPYKRPPIAKAHKLALIMEPSFAAFALIIASLNEIPVFGSPRFSPELALLALAFLVASLFYDALEWRFTAPEKKQRILDLLPGNKREWLLGVPALLILAAGEEIVYRAVLFGFLYKLIGDYWIAGGISAIVFAFAHLTHGAASASSIFFMGLGLQGLVYISGGLYAAIAVHYVHNVFNMVAYSTLAGRSFLRSMSKVDHPGDQVADKSLLAEQHGE